MLIGVLRILVKKLKNINVFFIERPKIMLFIIFFFTLIIFRINIIFLVSLSIS